MSVFISQKRKKEEEDIRMVIENSFYSGKCSRENLNIMYVCMHIYIVRIHVKEGDIAR